MAEQDDFWDGAPWPDDGDLPGLDAPWPEWPDDDGADFSAARRPAKKAAPNNPPPAAATLDGTVERVIWQSGDGNFAVFSLARADGGDTVSATINGAPPPAGTPVTLTGEWTTHPRFGRQFKAISFSVAAPADTAAIERFLASGFIKGVGPAMARRLVAKFGAETLAVIAEQPRRLTAVAGIGPKTAAKIHASYAAQSELRDLMLWLEQHDAPASLAPKLAKAYGSLAIELLTADPYRICAEISGVGFSTADGIARSLGFAADGENRVLAGLFSTLSAIMEDGHVCLPRLELVERAARLLAVARPTVSEVLTQAAADGTIPKETLGDNEFFYPPRLYDAETETARRLLSLQETARPLSVESPLELVAGWELANGITLSDGQRDAMLAALTYGVFVLTGGPGTGKTTVVRGMVELLATRGLKVLLAAPTGRAAKRLAEATGRPAVTIHRLLEASAAPDEALFGRNEDSPLEANAIIIDEASMIDILLMNGLLAAVPAGCHIIFVGDAFQLPAVGPGSVLRDILRSGAVPAVRLTEIFRQAAESGIVRNAHAINQGRMPELSDRLGDDFVFLPAADEAAAADIAVRLAAETLVKAGYDPRSEIQVLSPMYRGECGVRALNRRLQARLNPPRPDAAEHIAGDVVFRVGDKVMQTRNDYEKEVFNGDIGTIISITSDGFRVAFGDEIVPYEKGELGSLALAYAMTVHKAQGSEYPVVVLPIVDGQRIMLRRALLYTAVTRAKDRVYLPGSKTALFTAVSEDRADRRYTLLTERLTHSLDM